jgi:hypothetical protein
MPFDFSSCGCKNLLLSDGDCLSHGNKTIGVDNDDILYCLHTFYLPQLAHPSHLY